MKFRICTLGTGTGIPRKRRRAPATLLISGQYVILFDTGPGTLRSLEEAGSSFREVDYVFYTHFHPDHISDFAPLLFASRSPKYGRNKILHVLGPTGLREIYNKYLKIFGSWIELPSSLLTMQEIDTNGPSCLELPFGILKSLPTYHTPQSLGYRIEVGKKPVFSITGDTDYGINLLELAKNTEILISECSFPDQQKVRGHLTPSEAGILAKESGCKRLILTHLYPDCDKVNIIKQCQKVYSKEIIVAEDLMWFEISR